MRCLISLEVSELKLLRYIFSFMSLFYCRENQAFSHFSDEMVKNDIMIRSFSYPSFKGN